MRPSHVPLLLLPALALGCVDGDKLGDEDYVPLDDGGLGAEGTDGSPGGDGGADDGVGASVDQVQITADGGCLDEPAASAPPSLTWEMLDGVPSCLHAPVLLPACGPVTVDLRIDHDARLLEAAYTAGDCESTCAWGLSWPLPDDLEPGTWGITAGPDSATLTWE